MKKDRFISLCHEAEAGRDAFVIHPATLKEGLVNGCTIAAEQLIVQTADGKKRRWNFHECEELSRMDREWARH